MVFYTDSPSHCSGKTQYLAWALNTDKQSKQAAVKYVILRRSPQKRECGSQLVTNQTHLRKANVNSSLDNGNSSEETQSDSMYGSVTIDSERTNQVLPKGHSFQAKAQSAELIAFCPRAKILFTRPLIVDRALELGLLLSKAYPYLFVR
ncbi:hypothetical protein MG293_017563 [Ovis ammon polii]|uniref:Uncharacterized protein n=1 Tax=Ovis ammon polii TaxID=230172 RepID=A0AAD4TQW8_OVIAM|nr:hypothetical protein MG293_017563 [Ovis ammon polii]